MELQNVDKPPSYDASKSVSTSTEEPPTYMSLYGRLRRAKKETKNPFEFLTKCCNILFESVLTIAILVLLLAIPISMIVVGSLNVDKCPIEPLIPRWLIVYGALATISLTASIIMRIYELHRRKTDENYKLTKFSSIKNLIDIFLFGWLICGSVWIYTNYESMNNAPIDSSLLCNKSCYYFAFSFITAHWVIVGLFCTCCICIIPCLCIAFLCSNKVNPEPPE